MTCMHMNAWAAAFDHPYFAVTDELGRFEIKGIPPGSYTLIAWHPGFNIVKFSASRPVYDEPHVIRQPLRFLRKPRSNLDSSFPSARSKSNGKLPVAAMNCRLNNHATQPNWKREADR